MRSICDLNVQLNFLDCKADGVGDDRSPSSSEGQSPDLDRNPSPPPDTSDGDGDAIGDTVYSKHWLFSTLTRLINVGFTGT